MPKLLTTIKPKLNKEEYEFLDSVKVSVIKKLPILEQDTEKVRQLGLSASKGNDVTISNSI